MDGLVLGRSQTDLGLGGRGCAGLRRCFVAPNPGESTRLLARRCRGVSRAFLLGDSGLDARLLGSRAVLLGDSGLDAGLLGSRTVPLLRNVLRRSR
jgi:hypothetical protein